MKTKIAIALGTIALTAGFATAATAADEGTTTYGKRLTTTQEIAKSARGSFDVYVDRVSGFTFVNTITGWKLTGQLTSEQLKAEQATVEKL
ncbi:hypothetical protein G3580_13795 [Nitrogeniibacter mangrovi]|uniref:Uncharacterized protein n=1 Tax=Nitrogeniibacter mangrovi TaxID=2016596 RepID=A0A6C1B4J1_9RHOO|nr:hypothetical protein [Nitrogeniibacter mangrovi]QID18602.1 hypothetical protein G3580_13795 [Nitrogeniibacter mangrovi]